MKNSKPIIEESTNLLRLFIHTDNAAFGETESEKAAECARILRNIAANLDDWDGTQQYQTIFDMNGNDVGRYRLKVELEQDAR